MRLIGKDKIISYKTKHASSRNSLDNWVRAVKKANWKNLTDVKQTCNTADYVKPYTVFNVKGNEIRIIALIDYEVNVVQITHVLDHEEYDKGKWKD